MDRKTVWKIKRFFLDRQAISSVLSNVLLASVVLSLGFGVQYWVYWRSVEYNNQYGVLVDNSIAQMKEKLVFEHIYYDDNNKMLTVYLMNGGKIDDTSIATISLSNETWEMVFYSIEIISLDGEPREELDMLEEGYFQLSENLVDDTSYVILIVTGRGKAFVTSFTA